MCKHEIRLGEFKISFYCFYGSRVIPLSIFYNHLPGIIVNVLTMSVVDSGSIFYNYLPGIIVNVLTMSVVDSGMEPQYNGKCAHLECGRSWVGAPV